MHGSPVGKLWTTEPSDVGSLVHLTSAGTVDRGDKHLRGVCWGEKKGEAWGLRVQSPRQRTFAGMEAEYRAVSRSIWIYFSHLIFYSLDFLALFSSFLLN